MLAASRYETTYTVREGAGAGAADRCDQWRQVERAKRVSVSAILFILAFAAAFVGGWLRFNRLATAEASTEVPAEALTYVPAPTIAPAVPPPAATIAPAVQPMPATAAASAAPTATPKKHRAIKHDPTRRALADLRRAQLDRASDL
jgi:hypothetical protein